MKRYVAPTVKVTNEEKTYVVPGVKSTNEIRKYVAPIAKVTNVRKEKGYIEITTELLQAIGI